jgi:hypothetical protein
VGGLPVYLDLIKASCLGAAIRRHVGAVAHLAEAPKTFGHR